MRVLAVLCSLFALAPLAGAQGAETVLLEQAGIAITPGQANGSFDAGRADLLRSLIPATLAPDVNVAIVEQGGFGNVVSITQAGSGNKVLVSQSGDALVLSFLQIGVGNTASLSITGVNNTIDGVQQGDGHAYILSMTGADTAHSLRQIGAGHRAEQYVAPGLLPVSIEQRGTSSEIVVVRQ